MSQQSCFRNACSIILKILSFTKLLKYYYRGHQGSLFLTGINIHPSLNNWWVHYHIFSLSQITELYWIDINLTSVAIFCQHPNADIEVISKYLSLLGDVEMRYISDIVWLMSFRQQNSIGSILLPYRLLYQHSFIDIKMISKCHFYFGLNSIVWISFRYRFYIGQISLRQRMVDFISAADLYTIDMDPTLVAISAYIGTLIYNRYHMAYLPWLCGWKS